MNAEQRVNPRFVIQLGLGLLVATPPLLHIPNTERILGIPFGKRVDCANGKEPENPQYPFDAIVVPGAGNVKSADGIFEPNFDEKMRLEAAAIAFLEKRAPQIILLNGVGTNGENSLIERRYLQNIYKALTNGTQTIPNELILSEEKSINTATNMEQLAKLTAKYAIKKVLIVTNAYQETRATLYACENGVAAASLSAEELLAQNNSGWATTIEERNNSWEIKKTHVKEGIEITWSLWDPKGKAPTLLRRKLMK